MRLLGALCPDIIAPAGVITVPGSGATVGGTTTFTITATDDHAVAGVQWKLDGVNQGAEITVAPFSKAINTTLLSDAAHTVQAVVRDFVGHTTTVSQVFNINNNPGGGNFGFGWNPTGGTGRRPYSFSNGSFAAPNYIDDNGWSWPGNAYSAHYKVQMRYTMATLESINGPQSLRNHAYALSIGGTMMYKYNSTEIPPGTDTPWFDVPDGYSGSARFHDWADGSGAGGTAYVGEVVLYWQYVWTH